MDFNEIIELMNTRNSINDNDPCVIEEYWKKLTSLFTGTEDEIMDFLYSLNDEQLMNASEVFDDIHEKLGYSSSFWEKLTELQKKKIHLILNVSDCR